METQDIIRAMQRSSLCSVAEDEICKRLCALQDIEAILRRNLTPENKVNAINDALSSNAAGEVRRDAVTSTGLLDVPNPRT